MYANAAPIFLRSKCSSDLSSLSGIWIRSMAKIYTVDTSLSNGYGVFFKKTMSSEPMIRAVSSAAKHSSNLRYSYISIISWMEIGETMWPLFGIFESHFSSASRLQASRMGVRLVLHCAATSTSGRKSPGRKRQLRIQLLRSRYIRSTSLPFSAFAGFQ